MARAIASGVAGVAPLASMTWTGGPTSSADHVAYSWLAPLNLIKSYRHVTALIHDTTNVKRKMWVANQRTEHPGSDFSLDRELPESFSFAILGDTGEGDASQWVVVDPFLREAGDTAFAIIASDIIYPSGRSASYRSKFYIPYRHYPHDIYGVPGNHDWYDELHGFMVHFCDNTNTLHDQAKPTIDKTKLEVLRHIRKNTHFQPNMYFSIDHPSLRIVCIDTGIKAVIDDEQEAWLRRVSEDPRPKILVSGNPLYFSGKSRSSLANVLAITEQFDYVLVVGGDTHNFQRYRIPVAGGGARTPRVACRQRRRGRVRPPNHRYPVGPDHGSRPFHPAGGHRFRLLSVAGAVQEGQHWLVGAASPQLARGHKCRSLLQETFSSWT